MSFKQFFHSKDYANSKFLIMKRRCNVCGLFSFFVVHLGCIHKYLLEGYIPIVDVQSYSNSLNGFNISSSNNWEKFFEQPFGYSLDEVLKKAKHIEYIALDNCEPRPNAFSIIDNYPRRQIWHAFANKYLPIKKEIIDLSKKLIFKLFKNSKNILGVLARGTDYVSIKPGGHPIPPNSSEIIHDVKKMDNKYNYDYIFFSTEDEKIRESFTKIFTCKLRQIKPNNKINYDYIKKDYFNKNKNIKDAIDFNKIYLLNIIILSKCLDIIAARCSGTVGIFVLTNGFRNIKVYNKGLY